MLPYWLMFLIPAFRALAGSERMSLQQNRAKNVVSDRSSLFVLFVLTAAIGLRYRVGGDWPAYLRYFEYAQNLNITEALKLEDPGYWLLNLLSMYINMGVLGVNLMSGLIFSAGLVIFCRNLPNPWLALSVAIPYLVIVVAMGYTRQSIALGLTLIGLVKLERHKYISFFMFVLIGATFHKSAVIIIMIAMIVSVKNKLIVYVFGVASLFVGYHVLLEDYAEHLITYYVDEQMESSGAIIRLAMNFVPALLFVLYGKLFEMHFQQYRLWLTLSIISIVSFLLFFVTSYSTAFDRMALYIIPLQLVVFSYMPKISRKVGIKTKNMKLSIIFYYAIVLFVWLNYSVHSKYWVPYRVSLKLEVTEPGYEAY